MMTHELKVWPEYFEAIVDGSKTFEVRRDDRGFQVGDTLVLREWDPNVKEAGVDWYAPAYTGRELKREVTYILRGPTFGIEAGYCVVGLSDRRHCKRLTIEKTELGYTVGVDSPEGSGKQEWVFNGSGADADQGIDELIEACGADEHGMDAWDDLQDAIYNFMEALHAPE